MRPVTVSSGCRAKQNPPEFLRTGWIKGWRSPIITTALHCPQRSATPAGNILLHGCAAFRCWGFVLPPTLQSASCSFRAFAEVNTNQNAPRITAGAIRKLYRFDGTNCPRRQGLFLGCSIWVLGLVFDPCLCLAQALSFVSVVNVLSPFRTRRWSSSPPPLHPAEFLENLDQVVHSPAFALSAGFVNI